MLLRAAGVLFVLALLCAALGKGAPAGLCVLASKLLILASIVCWILSLLLRATRDPYFR